MDSTLIRVAVAVVFRDCRMWFSGQNAVFTVQGWVVQIVESVSSSCGSCVISRPALCYVILYTAFVYEDFVPGPPRDFCKLPKTLLLNPFFCSR